MEISGGKAESSGYLLVERSIHQAQNLRPLAGRLRKLELTVDAAGKISGTYTVTKA